MQYNSLNICRYQFEFLSSSPLPTVLSGIEFQNRLSELLTDRSKVDTIFDFVDNCTNESKQQSPEFIKELMTAVCQCVFIGEIEEKRLSDVKNHFANYVPVCYSNYIICEKNVLPLLLVHMIRYTFHEALLWDCKGYKTTSNNYVLCLTTKL